MKLTINKLNELHVAGKISDHVYDQYCTLLMNSEDIKCDIGYDGRITFRVKILDFDKK